MFFNSPILINIDSLLKIGIALSAFGVALSYSNIYLFHIWFFFLGIIWIIQQKVRGNVFSLSIRYSNHILFLIGMLVWYTITIFWTPDIILGLKYLFYIICGIIITSSIIQLSSNIEKFDSMFRVLCCVFIIELIVASSESFDLFRWPISPYSPWHKFFGKEVLDSFATQNLSTYFKSNPPTGFHWNTNNLAITMVLILPFFLCHKKLSLNIIGSLSITLITIFSASRAVFLALILIFILYLLIIKKRIAILSLIWIFILGLFWGIGNFKDSEDPRINEIANSGEALQLFLLGNLDIGGSLEWRRQLVNDGIDSLINSKGLGVGAGGTTAIQEKKGGVAGRFTSMHNFWIEILVEGGIIFGILGLIWYINILINLYTISRNKFSPELIYYSKALMLSMVGFVPAAISASSTIYFFPMWIMFGMAISIITLYRKSLYINN